MLREQGKEIKFSTSRRVQESAETVEKYSFEIHFTMRVARVDC